MPRTQGAELTFRLLATLIGDERWSYQRLLHYFQKVDKVMHTTKGAREYPLKEPLRIALVEAGLQFNEHANDGNPLGFAALTENWKDGKRQPAGKAYDISRVSVFTDVTVKRIVIDEEKTARGIELVDSRIFTAKKEVIVCCGSIKTPQLLMLSGIGPINQLASHSIPNISDLPVGEGLHDHLSATMYFKLKHPERGLAIGSSLFSKMAPDFESGNPIDWIVTESIKDPSRAAECQGLAANDPLITQPRGHVEFFVSYAPIAAPAFFDHSLAGTHISTPILGLLPTSRGSIRLASPDPTADPIIDPNYLDTEIDREAMRTGVRSVLRTMLDTTAGRSVIEDETPPPGQHPLSSSSSDSEIDDRLAAVGRSFYQCAGTAAMGKVVDTTLKVKGVEGLRVVDASILPLPLAGHYQYPVYAIAELATDLILDGL